MLWLTPDEKHKKISSGWLAYAQKENKKGCKVKWYRTTSMYTGNLYYRAWRRRRWPGSECWVCAGKPLSWHERRGWDTPGASIISLFFFIRGVSITCNGLQNFVPHNKNIFHYKTFIPGKLCNRCFNRK